MRDNILRWGGLIPLLKVVASTTNFHIVKCGTWAISNLNRGRPVPKFYLVKETTPVFCGIIKQHDEDDIQSDACWSMTLLSKEDETIKTVIETGVVPSLIKNIG